MNYYSKDLISKFDNEDSEYFDHLVRTLYGNTHKTFLYYARHMMNRGYINNITFDEEVNFAYYCIDPSKFAITNCPSIMAYKTVFDIRTRRTDYYILMICTKPNCRQLGYATALLAGFIERCKEECEKENAKLKKPKSPRYTAKIILSSVENAVTYYEHVGFKWTRKCLNEYPELMNYERYEPGKEYFMMEYEI